MLKFEVREVQSVRHTCQHLDGATDWEGGQGNEEKGNERIYKERERVQTRPDKKRVREREQGKVTPHRNVCLLLTDHVDPERPAM